MKYLTSLEPVVIHSWYLCRARKELYIMQLILHRTFSEQTVHFHTGLMFASPLPTKLVAGSSDLKEGSRGKHTDSHHCDHTLLRLIGFYLRQEGANNPSPPFLPMSKAREFRRSSLVHYSKSYL